MISPQHPPAPSFPHSAPPASSTSPPDGLARSRHRDAGYAGCHPGRTEMFDSPLAASAYEILGVDPAVDHVELRRAHRLRLRQTHPDTGGDSAVFIRVQRAWELVGPPQDPAA